LYTSAVVVEFEKNFVERTKAFRIIQQVINNEISIDLNNYQLKRLSYGYNIQGDIGVVQSVDQLIATDVSIERRAGEPAERNRFFCTAPLRTDDHLLLLEKIERAVINEA
jgi:hypothetical protein